MARPFGSYEVPYKVGDYIWNWNRNILGVVGRITQSDVYFWADNDKLKQAKHEFVMLIGIDDVIDINFENERWKPILMEKRIRMKCGQKHKEVKSLMDVRENIIKVLEDKHRNKPKRKGVENVNRKD